MRAKRALTVFKCLLKEAKAILKRRYIEANLKNRRQKQEALVDKKKKAGDKEGGTAEANGEGDAGEKKKQNFHDMGNFRIKCAVHEYHALIEEAQRGPLDDIPTYLEATVRPFAEQYLQSCVVGFEKGLSHLGAGSIFPKTGLSRRGNSRVRKW